MAEAREFPADYWSKARFWYCRAPDRHPWGVDSSDFDVTLPGLDKNDAAAIACILNGDHDLALSLLESLRRADLRSSRKESGIENEDPPTHERCPPAG